MSDENEIDELTELRRRVNSIDDYAKNYLVNQIEARDDRIDDLENRVDRLENLVLEVQENIDGIAGLAKDENATPEKRASDIRTALIRRAQARDMQGAKMWWRDAWNTLLDLGHEDLSDKNRAKPLIYNAMEKAAEGEGFAMTTTKTECADGVKREVKAIRVDLEELPASAAGNGFTTAEGPATSRETIDSEGNTTNLSD
ncbi:hypothetical protein [Halopiger xanaduensis]|uniref:Uncharacterized protein n=1 Tax=Halopiger xanaduensis (strain DSM 18323 / JCM 14033 / SH-6) TaxID=797210 RepID=F8DEM2_HALXS|nr:hypothetical protein [Halopiger xanaduensis]AEH39459.1 hypothetical protein Halxa_0219 [Halopiger xanaduensis SH-6]